MWISFPELPANLYHEDCLRSIAGNFGNVLRIHERTLAMSDTAEALVCVEMDLAAQRKERLWIDLAGQGYWQNVNYHRVPRLCSYCHKLGHDDSSCRKKLGIKGFPAQSAAPPKARKAEYRPCRMDLQLVRPKSPEGNRFAILNSVDECVFQDPLDIAVNERPSSSKPVAANMELGVSDPGSSSVVVELPSNQIGSQGELGGPVQDDKGKANLNCDGSVTNFDLEGPVIAVDICSHNQAKVEVNLPKVYEAGKAVADRAFLDNSLMQTCGLGRGAISRRLDKEGCMVTRSRARSAEDSRPPSQ